MYKKTLHIEVALSKAALEGKTLQCAKLNALYSIFLFLIFISSVSVVSAQPLQNIYSGLDQATSLYVTSSVIYVVEQGKNRVLKLDHTGKLLDTMGGNGSGNYQFSKPVDVDATNGLKVFVTDYNNRRIQVFDRRGQYLSSISGSNAFGQNVRYSPTQIAVNGLGEVFFVDENQYSIQRFGLDANLLDAFRIPPEVKQVDDLVITPREILLLDKKSATIHRLSLNGNYTGFYPAKGVKALFASEQGIWTAYSNQIERIDRSKQKEIKPFNTEIDAVNLQVRNEEIYILTSTSLFRINGKK
jgi:hypothetical protein